MKSKLEILEILTKQRLFHNLSLSVILLLVLVSIPLPAYCSPNISIKQTAIKFLLAMGGVILSSLIIYGGLTIYNKLFHGSKRQKSEQENTLISPNNLDNAIDFFIKKNKLK